MNTISISRRKFAQLLSAGAAATLVRPALSVGKPPEHGAASTGVVRLSANENPYGPSPKALKAMTDSFGLACRYPDEHNNVLIERLAKLNNVGRDQILLGGARGVVLHGAGWGRRRTSVTIERMLARNDHIPIRGRGLLQNLE